MLSTTLLDLKEIEDLAKEKQVKVLICHVLRYTPFYRTIKQLINSDFIGKIISIEMNEHVGIAHFLDSYVRGKWNSEERCGSGFLLAKCCHDTDLMCWLNGFSVPEKVSSFGARGLFILENAPKGATEYCYDCPHNDTCLYSAQKVHLEFDSMPFQTWAEMNKPLDEISKAEKAEYLKTHTYGKCAYNTGGDIQAEGLPKDSIVLLEQITTIDKIRLKKYIGELDDLTMGKVDQAIAISLGIKYLEALLE